MSNHSLYEATLSTDAPKRRPVFIVGVSGGAASGKKQVSNLVKEAVVHKVSGSLLYQNVSIAILSQEDFHRSLSEEEHAKAVRGAFNFDHPDAFDFDLLENVLLRLLKGERVEIPRWDFSSHKRIEAQTVVEKPDVVIISGILMLYKSRIRQLLSLKVFVDLDSDDRLARQVIRDSTQRYNNSLNDILRFYMRYVKPSFEEFVLPTKKFADLIIPRGETNAKAIDVLAQHIVDLILARQHRESINSTVDGCVDDDNASVCSADLFQGLEPKDWEEFEPIQE